MLVVQVLRPSIRMLSIKQQNVFKEHVMQLKHGINLLGRGM